MRILLVHQAFPGQFVHLLPRLLARGDQVVGVGLASIKLPESLLAHEGFEWSPYQPDRGNAKDVHPLAVETESKVLRGSWVAEKAQTLKDRGWQPDLVMGHSGWGELLFIDDIWPGVPQLHYMEFAYGAEGPDTGFDREGESITDWRFRAKGRMKNAAVWLSGEAMCWGVTPTLFQRSAFPKPLQGRISVVHDGIDCTAAHRDSSATLQLPSGAILRAGDPVITFVNRTYEPYRGIRQFMRALPRLQTTCREAQVVMIGRDTPKVSYGARRTDQQGWFTTMKEELGGQVDWSRVHNLGHVPKSVFLKTLQVSCAHVYLTYPFVLSWSLLEAMACECLVIGSRTPPVEEVIQSNYNGILVDFFDTDTISSTMIEALQKPRQFENMRRDARKTVLEKFELGQCQNRMLALLDLVATGGMPSTACIS